MPIVQQVSITAVELLVRVRLWKYHTAKQQYEHHCDPALKGKDTGEIVGKWDLLTLCLRRKGTTALQLLWVSFTTRSSRLVSERKSKLLVNNVEP